MNRNISDLVLVNGPDANGTRYTDEPAVILAVMDNNMYLIKFISTYYALGTTNAIHGENTAEIHGNYLTLIDRRRVTRHLNLSDDYVKQRISAIIGTLVFKGNLVLVNGRGMNGIMYTQEPGIIIDDSNNRYTVKFLKNLDVAVFIDRGCLEIKNKMTQLGEISSIMKMSVANVRNIINGIHMSITLAFIKSGGNKKSLKRRRSDKNRYNSLKKSKNIS